MLRTNIIFILTKFSKTLNSLLTSGSFAAVKSSLSFLSPFVMWSDIQRLFWNFQGRSRRGMSRTIRCSTVQQFMDMQTFQY